MLSLGLSGGLDHVGEWRDHIFIPGICHDAAVALAEGGTVVQAIEEERFNRIKHTTKGPVHALRHCLDAQGVKLSDIDRIVYYGSEEGLNLWTRNLFYGSVDAAPVTDFRTLLGEFFEFAVGEKINFDRLGFVNHHLAHAISAYVHSGFSESLVVTLDGGGDGLSGSVTRWHGNEYELLATVPSNCSLGTLYDRVIQMLGFGFTEEFKVMGLAPYGGPARFGTEMKRLYSLLPGGAYVINWGAIETLYGLAPVRKKNQPILQEHIDIAAALQDALEQIVFHFIGHFAQATGLRELCFAGGVAHNSTLNGKLLYSGMFSDIFVHPAAADSGCAMGAALSPFVGKTNGARPVQRQRLNHVFFGTDLASAPDIHASLERWSDFLTVEKLSDVAAQTAVFLAQGEVIGWAQGRSEFGPRALGHRSILADPRPAANKDIVNEMVKKREAFRPFAPAVTEEHLDDFFELPHPGMSLPFMSFTVKVRPEYRDILGAVTHVDGTARVQTVSRATDPAFHGLLEAFGQLTGVPVLLNTSFNNNAEPIVDSIDDVVTCFLTTGLNRVVAPPFSCVKRAFDQQAVFGLAAIMPGYARLVETTGHNRQNGLTTNWMITNSFDRRTYPIGENVYRLLRTATPDVPMRALGELVDTDRDQLAADIWGLWRDRAITLRPPV
jgi:carbamoyltransferase